MNDLTDAILFLAPRVDLSGIQAVTYPLEIISVLAHEHGISA